MAYQYNDSYCKSNIEMEMKKAYKQTPIRFQTSGPDDLPSIRLLKELHNELAPILKTHFTSSFSNPGDKEISINLNKIEELRDINIEENGVNKLLANLKPNKASGPDNIPARLLKELSNELSPIFTILFQASINHGRVPKDWKLANVTIPPPCLKKVINLTLETIGLSL